MHSDIPLRLRQVLAGDRRAAAWLFDTFAPRLYRRLGQRYAYPGGPETDDLLQDAFVYFFQDDGRALRRFLDSHPAERQTAERLETFLWDAACGVATNRRRAAARRKVVPISEEVPLKPMAEREAISRQALKLLEECLKKGRERVFLYFVMRYRDGLAPEEISKISGWSRKATYKLKQALDQAVERCVETVPIEEV